ncbi:MAG: ATP synthase F1 subunit delta [Proteobacteria bacterium]|nr:MAG: ATP synthase F1 subunit delta [Pseudomonadota bacterium]
MAKDDGKVASRYARALFELCAPQDLDAVSDSLKVFVETWSTHAELRSALANPSLPLETRLQVLRDSSELVRPNDKLLANFLCVLLTNDRLGALPQVSTSFEVMLKEFKKVLALEVTSAFQLSEQEREELRRQIEKNLSKEGKDYSSLVSIDWKVNKGILGGLRIKAGDKLLDGSIAGSLQRIEKELRV